MPHFYSNQNDGTEINNLYDTSSYGPLSLWIGFFTLICLIIIYGQFSKNKKTTRDYPFKALKKSEEK